MSRSKRRLGHSGVEQAGLHSERPPRPSSDSVARRMASTHQRDTPCELDLRRLVHRAGLRYRVDQVVLSGLRRRADIVFRGARVAVFVDGCFWHCCPQHGTMPKANSSWWRHKLAANKARDEDTNRVLTGAGWVVLRFWEHEDPVRAAASVIRTVRRRIARM